MRELHQDLLPHVAPGAARGVRLPPRPLTGAPAQQEGQDFTLLAPVLPGGPSPALAGRAFLLSRWPPRGSVQDQSRQRAVRMTAGRPSRQREPPSCVPCSGSRFSSPKREGCWGWMPAGPAPAPRPPWARLPQARPRLLRTRTRRWDPTRSQGPICKHRAARSLPPCLSHPLRPCVLPVPWVCGGGQAGVITQTPG